MNASSNLLSIFSAKFRKVTRNGNAKHICQKPLSVLSSLCNDRVVYYKMIAYWV